MTESAGTKIALICLVVALAAACGDKSAGDSIVSAKQSMAKRDYAAAVIELKTVLQQSPNSGEARYLLGVALLEQGNPSAALLELGKAQDQSFNDELLAPKLARALLGTGKFKEVVQTYDGVMLGAPPLQAELGTAVAMAYAGLSRRGEAEAALADALNADPKYPLALLTKARFLAASRKFDDALSLVDQAIVPDSPSGEAYLLRGFLQRYAKLDAAGAFKAFEQAAQDPSVTLTARTMLVHMLLEQRRMAEAQAQLAVLRKSHPRSAQTLYLEATVAYAAKDYGRSEALAEQLLRLAPDNARVLVLAGASSMQRGALLEAEARLGKVVQTVEGAPGARKLLAEAYLRMGQAEKALDTLAPFLAQGGQPDADALAVAGRAQLTLGRYQEAESLFAASARLNPDNLQTRTALALTDMARGNVDAAFDALRDISAKDPGETADLALITARLNRREHDAALAAVSALEQKAGGKLLAAHLRGAVLRAKGDTKGARAAFEASLTLDPGHYASIASLAALDLQEGNLDAARKRLQAAMTANPRNTAARMAVLDLMARQKATPAELEAFIEEAIRVAPGDAAPRVAKISHHARLGSTKAAASAALDAVAALPSDAGVLDVAGRALAAAGEVQQAAGVFNKLAGVLPGSALPHLRLADLQTKHGTSREVASSLGRAFEAEPLSTEVHKRLLDHAVMAKDFQFIDHAAKQLQNRFPAFAHGFLIEGDAAAARKNWPRAIAQYRRALDKQHGRGRPERSLYLALGASGDPAGAERFASGWVSAHPTDSGYSEFLGSQALLRRDFAGAEAHFRRMLAARPDSVAAMNNIAWLMAERGAVGAVEMAEKALALQASAAPVMDTLAKALAAEGKLDRALEVQRQATAAMPNRPQYRVNLIRLYIRAGKKLEAGAELDGLLSRHGSQSIAPEELARLRKELGR